MRFFNCCENPAVGVKWIGTTNTKNDVEPAYRRTKSNCACLQRRHLSMETLWLKYSVRCE